MLEQGTGGGPEESGGERAVGKSSVPQSRAFKEGGLVTPGDTPFAVLAMT